MKINYLEEGVGSCVVLLHGWGMNANMMKPVIRSLSRDYRCICLDLFGFGETDEIRDYHHLSDYIEELHQFLESLNVQNPIMIAHSFGARLAVLYASKYDVKAMILTGAAGIKQPLSWKKKMKIFLHKKGFLMKGSYDYEKASPFLKKVLVESVNTDLSNHMKHLQFPVLLVWGEKDKETPLWMGKKMEQLLNASLVVFKGEDHFAYYHESERFCFICKQFIEEVEMCC